MKPRTLILAPGLFISSSAQICGICGFKLASLLGSSVDGKSVE
jgi:hypothetical protein